MIKSTVSHSRKHGHLNIHLFIRKSQETQHFADLVWIPRSTYAILVPRTHVPIHFRIILKQTTVRGLNLQTFHLSGRMSEVRSRRRVSQANVIAVVCLNDHRTRKNRHIRIVFYTLNLMRGFQKPPRGLPLFVQKNFGTGKLLMVTRLAFSIWIQFLRHETIYLRQTRDCLIADCYSATVNLLEVDHFYKHRMSIALLWKFRKFCCFQLQVIIHGPTAVWLNCLLLIKS